MSRPRRRGSSAANPIDTAFGSGQSLATVKSKAGVDYDCVFVKDMKDASAKVSSLFQTCLSLHAQQVADMVGGKNLYK